MSVSVDLGPRSKKLLNKFNLLCPSDSQSWDISAPIPLKVIVAWLQKEMEYPSSINTKKKKDIDFTLANLQNELMRDIVLELSPEQNNISPIVKKTSRANKAKFIMLAVAGTLLAACEGFDSITTMLSVFSLPASVILMVGFVFSALSVVVFYGFDLVQVSQNLGIALKDAPKLLDVYLLQMEEIKAIRKKIGRMIISPELSNEDEDLSELLVTLEMLEFRLAKLVEDSKFFKNAVQSPKMILAKNIFAGVAGLLFFGGGFFAGQSVALFMLSLVLTGMTVTSIPVIALSVVVGLAAFSLYWYIERVGLKALISGWFGLDEEKIKDLPDEELLNVQCEKISVIKNYISKIMDKNKKHEVEQTKEQSSGDLSSRNKPSQAIKIRVSTNKQGLLYPKPVNQDHKNNVGDAAYSGHAYSC